MYKNSKKKNVNNMLNNFVAIFNKIYISCIKIIYSCILSYTINFNNTFLHKSVHSSLKCYKKFFFLYDHFYSFHDNLHIAISDKRATQTVSINFLHYFSPVIFQKLLAWVKKLKIKNIENLCQLFFISCVFALLFLLSQIIMNNAFSPFSFQNLPTEFRQTFLKFILIALFQKSQGCHLIKDFCLWQL